MSKARELSELAGVTSIDVNGVVTLDGRVITTDGTKLDTVEASADVTDTVNVTSAGALMDSELAGLVAVKATTGTFLVADQTKLDGIEASADVTDTVNVTSAGALMDSELAGIAAVKATTGTFLTADETKLDGIEALADVTDTASVTAAGALMDSEVDANIKTLVLPASTTISAYGASIIDDANAAAARTTLDVDQAGDALAFAIALG